MDSVSNPFSGRIILLICNIKFLIGVTRLQSVIKTSITFIEQSDGSKQ